MKRSQIHAKDKDKHMPYLYAALGVIAIIILVLLAMVIATRHSATYQTTRQRVQSYYTDYATGSIKEPLDQTAIDNLTALNQKLSSPGWGPVKKDIQYLLNYHQVYQQMDQAFDGHPLEQTTAPLVLAAKTNQATLTDLTQAIRKIKRTPATDQLLKVIQEGEALLAKIDQFDQYQAEVKDIVAAGDLSQVSRLIAIRQEGEQLKAQPPMQAKLKAFDEAVAPLGKVALDHHESFIQDPTQAQPLFQLPSIADQLTGQPYDQRPLVALTFDDGPAPSTEEVLAILDKYQIKATFFQLGRMIAHYPEITKKVYDKGHQVANHSTNHPDLNLLTDAQIQVEIDTTNEAIRAITGSIPKLIRTPYGNNVRGVKRLYPDQEIIGWNVDSMDWDLPNPQALADYTLAHLHHRSIILMHDIHPQSVQALPIIIESLIAQGYHFVMPQQIPEADTYYSE